MQDDPQRSEAVRVADGETITAKERRDVVILSARDGLTITWSRYAGGEEGPGLHVHRRHTDAFYVLEGELTFGLGAAGDRLRVAAGGFLAVPPNVAHSFANEGPGEARWLNFHAPDYGFAQYLRDVRDGVESAGFDNFDVPANGGLPAADVVVTGPREGDPLDGGGLVKGALPQLRVAERTVRGGLDADASWVLDGELRFTVDGTERMAGPGTLVLAPDVAGDARVLSIHAPGGGAGTVR